VRGRVARPLISCLVVAVLSLWAQSIPGLAQQRDTSSTLSGDMSPLEVQRLFDAFELVRAEEMLTLSEQQYPEFVKRFKVLQDARRRGQQERKRRLKELQRISDQPGADESMLADQLEALATHDQETAELQRSAIAEIDTILDVQQQVRFRIFEEAMERRRSELRMLAGGQPLPQ